MMSDAYGRLTTLPWQTLSETAPFSVTGVELFGVDVSGDGLMDVVYWWQEDSGKIGFLVARAVGDGSFSLGAEQIVETPFVQFYPSDVNGDGRMDLVGTLPCLIGRGYDSRSCGFSPQALVGALLAQPDGQFVATTPQDLQFDAQDYNVLSGDVNGDGKGDLVFESTCNTIMGIEGCVDVNNRLLTFLGNGAGGFVPAGDQLDTSDWGPYQDLIMADVTGDGRDDLVWMAFCPDSQQPGCHAGGKLLVRLVLAVADGPDPFAFGAPLDMGFGYWGALRSYWVADVDGDGDTDVVLRNFRGEGQAGAIDEMSFGPSGPTIGPLRILPGTGWGEDLSLRAGDLTGEGEDELVFYRDDGGFSMPERVAVLGDLSEIPPPTTTTTTTLPAAPDCAAIPGLPGLQCSCDLSLAVGACAGATIPAKVGNGFTKACAAIGQATAGSGKPPKLLKKAGARLGKSAKAAGKRKVRSALPEGCSDSLKAFLTELRNRTKQVRSAL